ncbi:MAG: DUF1573 domain-containing protein [Verrucomicrobia bacterium]|jgi:hypothetical protein|nr:DUF1573 domain-containing protein [Verrucomicrobiota bacterium]
MKLTKIGLAFGVLIAGTETAVLQAQPAPQPAAASTNAALSPKIEFATPIYDFGKAKISGPVKHDYVFTNTGQAMLEVTAVHPGCGCTTAGTWTRQVEPGKTGIIPIQYNAPAIPGSVAKVINVTCNDPRQPTVVLQIKGTIWSPIEVVPTYAVFNVTSDSVTNATSSVRILNNEETPLTLSAPEINNPNFAAEVKTKQPGKEFEVVVRLVPPLNGENTQGVITLKTSSTNMPLININASARLQPALVANPPVITLPPAPNTNNVRPVIYIRNNSPSAFALSDPVVNAKGVDVQIKEIEPGRYATVTLTFPPDFTNAPGERIQLSLKTGLAQPPTFEVPVFQLPRVKQ